MCDNYNEENERQHERQLADCTEEWSYWEEVFPFLKINCESCIKTDQSVMDYIKKMNIPTKIFDNTTQLRYNNLSKRG